MPALPRLKLNAFLDASTDAELDLGTSARFNPELEAEYVRTRLSANRKLIRVTCMLAVLLAAFRGIEQTLAGAVTGVYALPFIVVLAGSAAIASIAWSRAFERLYLPVANIVVPVRNATAAIGVAGAAAHGQPELLMVLPFMVLGPFFFLGLTYRVALLSVALTVITFIASSTTFELALPVALRASVLLAMAAVACGIAARHVERWSRASFLERHMMSELAEHDALTGLKNRRIFDEQLNGLWERGIEEARTIAILLMDVDHFKAYNDRYGHQAGDQALRRVAQTLKKCVPGPLHVLARYGGEEFAVILYDVDSRRAEAVAERMRLAVGELAIEHRESRAGVVTISAGVAVIEPSRERRSRGALQLADQALYDAKLQGRNRVVVVDDAAHGLLVTGVFSKPAFARGR